MGTSTCRSPPASGLSGANYPVLSLHGYAGSYSSVIAYASAGEIGVNVACSKSNGMFYGSVTDSLGNPVPGICVSAEDNNDVYYMEGYTDTNGNYALGVLGGLNNDPWSVGCDNDNSPANYFISELAVDENGGTNLSVGQALLQNFTAILATNQITGSLKDNYGNPIAGVGIYADATIDGIYCERDAPTDANGNYSLNVANGTWDVGVEIYGEQNVLPDIYIPPADQYAVISNDNAALDFAAAIPLTNAIHNGKLTYTINNSAITIVGFKFDGPGRALTIPSEINNMPVTSIGDSSFLGQSGLISVTIPSTVTNIGEAAFAGCSLSSVYLEGNAPSADSSVFANNNNNATVYFPPDTTGWSSSFGGLPAKDQYACTTNAGGIIINDYSGPGGPLIIPAAITGLAVSGIAEWAFEGCSNLTSITIPGTVTNIGDLAFFDCGNLTAIMVNPTNPCYSSANGVLFDKAGSRLIQCPGGLNGSYTIPNGVTNVGDYAFANTGLTNITIPSTVVSIGASAFENCFQLRSLRIPMSVVSIGDYAFANTGLSSVYFDGNAPSADRTVFRDGPWTAYYVTGTTGWSSTFAGLRTLLWDPSLPFGYTVASGAITIASYFGPGGAVALPAEINGLPVTTIGTNAFNACTNATDVTIPSGVTSIEFGAFGACSSLTNVAIPLSVTNIGDYAFGGCSRLTAITVNAGNPFFSTLNGVLFDKSQTTLIAFPGGLGGSYTIPMGVAGIQSNAFYGIALTSVTIPGSLAGVPDSAFANCGTLTNVTILDGVTSIGAAVFQSCSSLSSVTIPAGVTNIGPGAFYGCTALPDVTIPNSVTRIGDAAFQFCTSLTDVTLPDSLTGIPPSALADCYALTNVTIPYSVTSIGDWAFDYCESLASVLIPSSVTNIGAYAFTECFNLNAITVNPGNAFYTSVNGVLFDKPQTTLVEYPGGPVGSYTLPGTVTNIADGAFDECGGLTTVTIPSTVTSFGEFAFFNCKALTAAFFQGNAPSFSMSFPPFYGANNATVYYLPGTMGWGTKFAGVPTVLLAFDYTVDNGTITITGYSGPGGAVTVPSAISNVLVTSIGDYAFTNCSSLTSVMIPGTVTRIGAAAFLDCVNLTNATMPNSVTSIGDSAFSGCLRLTNVTIPNSVTSIGDNAFDGCTNLVGMTIPGSVTNIGAYTFENCAGLTAITVDAANGSYSSVNGALFDKGLATLIQYPPGLSGSYTIPGTVTSIGDGAFSGCSGLTSVTIPAGVSAIGEGAFEACDSLANVYSEGSPPAADSSVFANDYNATVYYSPGTAGWDTSFAGLPTQDSYGCTTNAGAITINTYTGPGGALSIPAIINGLPVTGIADAAFQNQSCLISVTIPGSVTTIGEGAFLGCTNLMTVLIPSSVTTLGDDAFESCASLASVTIPNSITSIGNQEFSGCTSLMIATIPNSVTNIGDMAFESCSSLTNIAIPGSVISIGYTPFVWCTSLRSITVDPNNPAYCSVNGVLFDKERTTLLECPGALGGGYTIPMGVTAIGDSAFYACSNLVRVTVSSGVTSIGDLAFNDCYSLISAAIPDSVTSIGMEPFLNCASLTAITVAAANPFYSSANGVLFDHNRTTLIQYPLGLAGAYTIPNGATNISDNAFVDCVGLTGITMPASVTGIGDCAFSGCTNLTSLTIGANVRSVGDSAFFDCSSLTNLTIPGSVASIEGFAFYGCGKLAAVTVPAGVTNIGSDAFLNCTSLGSVSISGSVSSLGEEAFASCYGLTNVTIANGLTSIGQRSFIECTSLPSLVIPASVTNIGDEAFRKCVSLTGVYFQGNAPSANTNVFHYDDNATAYYLPGTLGWGSTLGGLPTMMLITEPYSDLVQNGSFQAGDLTGWTLSGDTGYTFLDAGSESGITPYSANYEAALGTSGSPGYLSQTLATTPGSRYSLSLWLNSPYGDSANEFRVSWNGSALFDQTNIPALGWTNLQFSVSATGTNTVLQFGFQDDASYLGLDYITVVPAQSGLAGPLQVTITPAAAVTAGAQWQVDEGTLQNSGATITNLAAGNHTVSFTSVSGWNTPANETLTITNGAATTVTGVYALAAANLADIKLSGANVVLNAVDGRSGGTYQVLMSRDPTLPLSQWTPVATNVLSANGNFTISVSNAVSRILSEAFYILQTQ